MRAEQQKKNILKKEIIQPRKKNPPQKKKKISQIYKINKRKHVHANIYLKNKKKKKICIYFMLIKSSIYSILISNDIFINNKCWFGHQKRR